MKSFKQFILENEGMWQVILMQMMHTKIQNVCAATEKKAKEIARRMNPGWDPIEAYSLRTINFADALEEDQIQELVDRDFKEATVVKNPTDSRTIKELNAAKYKMLRYLMYPNPLKKEIENDHVVMKRIKDPKATAVWIADANSMQHGIIADHAGVPRTEWIVNTLSGYIGPENIEEIRGQGLKEWIVRRHINVAETYISDIRGD